MFINGVTLLELSPIRDMLPSKVSYRGVSHGLSEAGYDIRIAETLILKRGSRFKLSSSMEYFTMPDCLVGEVKDKSTWVRNGLHVHNTVIEPGWCGYLTLELSYNGDSHCRITAGQGIAQILFSRVLHEASYDGKYQHQETGAQSARYK